jgi:polyvinyl alcohol dehydrogenase (cytochrome)
LGKLSAGKILSELETGTMREVGAKLTARERQSVAGFLGGGQPVSTAEVPGSPGGGRCGNGVASRKLNLSGPQWNGWGASIGNDRFQRAHAGLTREQVGSLKLKWAFGFEGDAWAVSQPVVVGSRVFIGSASGLVYALDLHSGCTYWTFKAAGPVRAAISVGPSRLKGSAASVFFSDMVGNAYRLDANSGQLVWKRHVEDHKGVRTTGSPVLYEGRLYVPVSSFEEVLASNPKYECCTFRGSVVALDAASGTPVWRAYSIGVPPRATQRNSVGTQLYGPSGAASYSPPTIDTRLHRLYFTTGNSYSAPAADTSDALLGVDLASGRVLWSTQPKPGDAFNVACLAPDKTNCPVPPGDDLDFASPAMLITTSQKKRLLVAGQKSGVVYAVDPDADGRKVWSTRVAAGGLLGGVMWGAAGDGDTIYVAISDSFAGGKLNPDAGGLVALRSSDGKPLWRIPAPPCGARKLCLPAQTAAVTLIPGVVFSGSRDGFLRAYSSISGRILWEFCTAREFETVNGVKAKGGTLDVSGAMVVDGIVLTTSGYPDFGGIGGNVLLAFSAVSSR